MAARNKVFKNYFGSKNANGLFQFIINHIPQHRIYIEGFLGGGTILQAKKPAQTSYCFDTDPTVIDAFNLRCSIDNVSYMNESFLSGMQLISDLLDPADTFIYLDPPYHHNTRTSTKRYRYEMTNAGHIDLLDYVAGSPYKIMLSCYDNDLYRSKLHKWTRKTVKSMTRGGLRTETIYMNYKISSLHDSRYIGKDFTDRQRIKRKVARHIKKLSQLEPLERECIIDEIISVFRQTPIL